MIVTLTDEYRVSIGADHTLEVYEAGFNRKTQEPSEPAWKILGYYPNMMQAIRAASQHGFTSTADTLTFKEYNAQLSSTLESYLEAAKKAFPSPKGIKA